MSDEKIVEFPRETPPPLLVGPFKEWRVIVQGRVIPKLTGYKYEDGRVSLTLDHRIGADFPNEEIASQAAWMIANAMAIGAGYPSMMADSKDAPFAPKGCEIKLPE
jgi:hypothetical protein